MTSFRPSIQTLRTLACTATSLLAATFIAACGSTDGPDERLTPPSPPPRVTSGLFDVTTVPKFDSCNSTTVYDSVYEIQITDTTFTMGTDWSGEWNPNTLKASGESEHVQSTARFCTTTTWSTVQLTFQSQDEFFGTIVYRRRLLGSCGSRTECQSSWTISGTRR